MITQRLSYCRCALACGWLTLQCFGASNSVQIVENHQSQWQVVSPSPRQPGVIWATQELRKYLKLLILGALGPYLRKLRRGIMCEVYQTGGIVDEEGKRHPPARVQHLDTCIVMRPFGQQEPEPRREHDWPLVKTLPR